MNFCKGGGDSICLDGGQKKRMRIKKLAKVAEENSNQININAKTVVSMLFVPSIGASTVNIVENIKINLGSF